MNNRREFIKKSLIFGALGCFAPSLIKSENKVKNNFRKYHFTCQKCDSFSNNFISFYFETDNPLKIGDKILVKSDYNRLFPGAGEVVSYYEINKVELC